MPVSRLSRLLDVIYRAAAEPAAWPFALREISDALGSGVSGLVVEDKRRGAFPIAAMDPRAPLPAMEEYTREFAAIDDLRDFARRRPAGEVLTEASGALPAILRRSTCYHEFYARWDLEHFIGSYLLNDDAYEASLVVYRGGPASSSYDEQNVATMQMIVPHLTRAVQISTRLFEAEGAVRGFGLALDALAPGVFMVDAGGKILWMSEGARALLSRNDGLTTSASHLHAASSTVNRKLQQLIAGAGARDLSSWEPGHLAIERPSGRSPYLMLISPFRGSDHGTTGRPGTVMLVVTDPEQTSVALRNHLRSIYHLTAAETELALALAEGKTMQQFAEEKPMTVHTARVHLKRILQKTGTHRQAELVNLLLRSPAAIIRG